MSSLSSGFIKLHSIDDIPLVMVGNFDIQSIHDIPPLQLAPLNEKKYLTVAQQLERNAEIANGDK